MVSSYIPRYIKSKSESVLVVDTNPDALMMQLTSGTDHSLYMNGRHATMSEVRVILRSLYNIPVEQC